RVELVDEEPRDGVEVVGVLSDQGRLVETGEDGAAEIVPVHPGVVELRVEVAQPVAEAALGGIGEGNGAQGKEGHGTTWGRRRESSSPRRRAARGGSRRRGDRRYLVGVVLPQPPPVMHDVLRQRL